MGSVCYQMPLVRQECVFHVEWQFPLSIHACCVFLNDVCVFLSVKLTGRAPRSKQIMESEPTNTKVR